MNDSTLILLAWLTLAAPFTAVLLSGAFRLLKRRLPVRRTRRRAILGYATRLLSFISLVSSILLTSQPQQQGLSFRLIIVDCYIDSLSMYFVLLVNLVAFFASWYTHNFLEAERPGGLMSSETFHLLFNGFHLTMLLVPMVDNLIVLWMAIELTTLVSTLLVRYRRRRQTVEAAFKYIITTTAGIVFALFGTIFLTLALPTSSSDLCTLLLQYTASPAAECSTTMTEIVQLMNWSLLAKPQVAALLSPDLVRIMFIFVVVGYGTKAGFAPMHTWLPDGHGEAPAPVSALLSGVLLKSALYAVLRFYTITSLNSPVNQRFASLMLLGIGLFSLVLATPFILKRNKFKRVLAYHSLEHMGIIAFGIGIGGTLGLMGALLHAFNHALTKALMFLTYGGVHQAYARALNVDEPDEAAITGVLRAMPRSGLILLLGGLGLVGSPPFNIFLSEFIILWAAFSTAVNHSWPYFVAAVLFLLTVAAIFAGLVGHLSHLLLDRPPVTPPVERHRHLAPLYVLLLLVILFGLWIPSWPFNFQELLAQSVLILQNGVGGGN